MVCITIDARPAPIADPEATALLLIDMQRDFLEPGGLGAAACSARRAPRD
jgi:hypothetical protein